MLEAPSVLGVILARGGSKRLPGKNLLPLGGRPLLEWTILAAQQSAALDRVVLSSDDPRIRAAAERLGCECLERPAALARDSAASVDGVLHVMDALERDYDWVVLLQPTSPLRAAADIDACVRDTLERGAPSGIAVCEAAHSPYLCVQLDEAACIQPLLPVNLAHCRSQDLPRSYRINGAVYVARAAQLRRARSFAAPGTVGFVMPAERSIDIDTAEDLRDAEFALGRESIAPRLVRPRDPRARLRIAVLATGRQDWGLLSGLCRELRDAPELDLALLAGGMACSERHGQIANAIRREFDGVQTLPWDVEQGAPEQAAAALTGTAEALRGLAPDALLVLGDRFETAAAALAAATEGLPIVHLYGGEETEGAIDNALRHAITKLSHLHFASHAEYAERIVQMGEPPESVHVVGSTAIDNCLAADLPGRGELEARLGLALRPPVGVVTLHPTTLAPRGSAPEVEAVLEALRGQAGTWVITLPNADPGHRAIRERLVRFAREREDVAAVDALGAPAYLGLLRQSDVVLGNSSSGLVEPGFFGVPSVNVGDRQKGRLREPSVLDAPARPDAIRRALARALSPRFRSHLTTGTSIFGDGRAAARMIEILRHWEPPRPARKRFTPPEPRSGSPRAARAARTRVATGVVPR